MSVVPSDCISPLPSKKVALLEKLEESVFKASILAVIPAILEVACVILCEKLDESIFKASIDDVIAVSYTHLTLPTSG